MRELFEGARSTRCKGDSSQASLPWFSLRANQPTLETISYLALLRLSALPAPWQVLPKLCSMAAWVPVRM